MKSSPKVPNVLLINLYIIYYTVRYSFKCGRLFIMYVIVQTKNFDEG